MTSRVINDPSALGWEYDPDTGRWTWGGHSSSGGGGGSFPEAPVDGEQYARQNAGWSVVEHPEGGTGGNDPRISDQNIANWNASFSWGDHSSAGYLTSETDPTVPSHVKSITTQDIANWNAGTGGGGGNDPRITDTQISNWDTSYGWGNHASQGYLTSASLSGYATQSWVSSNYQPKGSYLTSETDPTVPAHVKSITTSDINKWNNPPSGGGFDGTYSGNQVKFTCTNSTTALHVSAPNCGIFMDGTGGGQTGKFMRIAGDKWELLKGDYSAALLSVDDNGVVKTNNNFGGTSFTSNVNGQQLVTLYGNAMANSSATGAGLYFSQNAPSPTITPCRGSDFAQRDNSISLGNPSYRFFKVYSVNGVAATRRHTQNDGEAVLSVKDLIEVFETLREATKEEKTMEGLRDSIGNCVGGIVERLEAIQAATDEQTAQEMAMHAENEDEPMPPFTLTPELPPVE